MMTSGSVVELDLGVPVRRDVGFRHPAVVVTAQRIVDANPSVVQGVPLTTTIRRTPNHAGTATGSLSAWVPD